MPSNPATNHSSNELANRIVLASMTPSPRRNDWQPTAWRDQIPELLDAAMRTALRLCGERTLAEDGVQNAMLKLIRGIERFEGRAQLSTYFTRIVIHECRDLISKKQREHQQHGWNETDPPTPSLADPLEQAEATAQIQALVQSLPTRQREVLILSVWDQRSNEEIAELLNISVQNVYATLSMARKNLKQRLEKIGARNG